MAQINKLPSFKNDFSQWYQRVIYEAELVDQAPVRGTMVIRPYGYAIWEHIRNYMDDRIKATGHKNASFPLFIPESFLKKEAEHIEGFAPELAVVTHAGGKKLEEPLIVRPTSETIIHYMFARWIKSWRDLPLKINQWANVVRWEMRPRAFLRTTEFFWQEGHTAHETFEESSQEAHQMLDEYLHMCSNILALPTLSGKKSEAEKFPGAVTTLTFEGIMPDGKALQMGTSHLLSQSFAHAFDMTFQDKQGKTCYPYLTSWAITTRLVGALIMMHGDDAGLVLPPAVAPYQVVILPIFKAGIANQMVLQRANEMAEALRTDGIRVHIDASDAQSPGAKFYKWELKGVPLRIELGPRDIANENCILKRRVDGNKEVVPLSQIAKAVAKELEIVYLLMYQRAQQRVSDCSKTVETIQEIETALQDRPWVLHAGWCSSSACEATLSEYKASIRCIVPDKAAKHCFNCSKESVNDIIIAQAY